jgi:bifunctional ADP-heptose synthase (sugar kinase/adenylyltransferase)
LDTRTKILTPAALAALDPPRPLVLAMGRFDILRVEAIRDLDAARRRTRAQSLLAVVRPLSGELAPLEARAEMAAALRVVDYVFVAQDGDLAGLAASLQAVETINLEDADAERTRQLIEHVHSRQS